MSQSANDMKVGIILEDATDEQKKLLYHLAGSENQWPYWVPTKIRLLRRVRGSFPFGSVHANPGEHACLCNINGAISVKSEDGSKFIGVLPSECEFIEWGVNPHLALPNNLKP